MDSRADDATRLLKQLKEGGARPEDVLLPVVYEELRRLAHAKMTHEPPGHTLQTTALVHEAYLRLLGAENSNWDNRRHFFSAAAEAMRRILVERARRSHTLKRGGGRQRVAFHDEIGAPSRSIDLLALDEALVELEERDPRASQVIKMRYFIGLSIDETAEMLGVSARTVRSDWTVSKAWLKQRLSADGDQGAIHE